MRLVVLTALLILAFPSAAAANVQLISVTSAVKAGSYAQISVTAFVRAQCSIAVHYGSRPALVATGLHTKGTVFGTVQWRWQMPVHSIRGRWTIDIACGSAGHLRTFFSVR
jgi:hypothetical protein